MKQNKKKAVVLLSGGLDSTTTLSIAKEQGFELYALSFNYGQKNLHEIICAKKQALKFGAKHFEVALDLSLFNISSLVNNNLKVEDHKVSNSSLPSTYVPARNTIMLSVALGLCETLGASDIFIGANIHDYSGYPDCRPEYIAKFEELAKLATNMTDIRINAPLVNLSKADIISIGLKNGVAYEDTLSCYNPINDKPCTKCSACHYRQKGFDELQSLSAIN